jgi:hypothetical protein
MHYQFKGKMAARYLDKENCLANYKRAESIYLNANGGNVSLIMQSFYQFIVDDLAELGLEEQAMAYNKLYKKTL